MQRVGSIVTGAIGLVFFLAVIGFGISSTRSMPEYAYVLVDDAKRVYIAPPCVSDHAGLRPLTAREAYDLKYTPEDQCRNDGGFVADGRSVTGMCLQKIGLLRPLPERWNRDGTWNW
jgi:hypothetical protein